MIDTRATVEAAFRRMKSLEQEKIRAGYNPETETWRSEEAARAWSGRMRKYWEELKT